MEQVGESNAEGMINWAEIPYGEYEIVEIEAPTYKNDKGEVKSYQKLREPIKVTINKDNQTVNLTVENNKSGWILPATNWNQDNPIYSSWPCINGGGVYVLKKESSISALI